MRTTNIRSPVARDLITVLPPPTGKGARKEQTPGGRMRGVPQGTNPAPAEWARRGGSGRGFGRPLWRGVAAASVGVVVYPPTHVR